jgi:hypothetical protein
MFEASHLILVAHDHKLFARSHHQAQGRTQANSLEDLVRALNGGGTEAVGDRSDVLEQGPRVGGVGDPGGISSVVGLHELSPTGGNRASPASRASGPAPSWGCQPPWSTQLRALGPRRER